MFHKTRIEHYIDIMFAIFFTGPVLVTFAACIAGASWLVRWAFGLPL